MHTGFGLVVIWSEKTVEGSFEMAEIENSSAHEAEKWILFPNMYDLSFTQLFICTDTHPQTLTYYYSIVFINVHSYVYLAAVVFVVESKKTQFLVQ